MPGPRPSDDYNSTPSVAPTTQAPNDYLSVRASPQNFGAQVGQAVTGLGEKMGQASDQLASTALQYQGMINETMQTNADSQYQVKLGEIDAKYKSLEGLSAVAAHDDVVNQIQSSRQEIRSQLTNPAAQRGFDLLTVKSMGYAMRDAGSYAGTQAKKAHVDGANAGMNVQIQSLSDPKVAFDPQRSQDALDNTKYLAETQLQSLGNIVLSGPEQTVQTNADGTPQKDGNGDLVFTNNENGQSAKNQYQEFMNKAVGQGWYNRIETIAKDPINGNPLTALQVLEDNKDKIPPETYAKASALLAPSVRQFQARTVADNQIQQLDQGYSKSLGQSTQSALTGGYTEQGVSTLVTGLFPQAKITSTTRTPTQNEIAGGVEGSYHLTGRALDFVPPVGTSLQDAAKQLQSTNPNLKVIVEGPGATHSTGPHIHVQWEGEDPNTPTTSSNSLYQTKADYYNQHYADAIQSARQSYLQVHPGDIEGADAAATHTEGRMNEVRTSQMMQDRSDTDLVLRAVHGEFNNSQPLTSDKQLDTSTPEVTAAWNRMQVNNALGANNISNRVIPANTRGVVQSYGQNFSNLYAQVLSGKLNDPHQLTPYVGGVATSPLTNTGLQVLTKAMADQKSPENVAFSGEQAKFLTQLHNEATGAQFFPGGVSPNLEKSLNDQMPVLIQAIQAGHAAGKSSSQMFSPTINGKPNPDYVANSIKLPSFDEIRRANTSVMMSRISEQHPNVPAYDESKINSTKDIQQLFDSGKIKTPQELDKVMKNFKTRKEHERGVSVGGQ